MRNLIGAATIAILLAGCAGSPATIESHEEYLSAAGFRVLGAGTPGYAAAQQQLPPHKFVHHVEQGILTYYYYDPTTCACLYYGSEANWAAYKQEMAEKLHIEAEESLIKDNVPYSGQGGI